MELKKFLIYVSSKDNGLAIRLANQFDNATRYDKSAMKLLPFFAFFTILFFSFVLHFSIKPHDKAFSDSLSFVSYFIGTLWIFILLPDIIFHIFSLGFRFYILFKIIAIILLFQSIIIGTLRLYQKSVTKSFFALGLSMFGLAFASYLVLVISSIIRMSDQSF